MATEREKMPTAVRALMWAVVFQGSFTIALLTVCIVAISMISSTNDKINRNQLHTSEQLLRLSTRQESIEQKADRASSNSTKALAISGKAEANIAWIREGMTEMKMMFRNESFKGAK